MRRDTRGSLPFFSMEIIPQPGNVCMISLNSDIGRPSNPIDLHKLRYAFRTYDPNSQVIQQQQQQQQQQQKLLSILQI
jgi:hypothetical protein